MKIKSTKELAEFVSTVLPSYKNTGHVKDLRKIKNDPAGHGKSIIIWWGNPSLQDVTELRVTVNLGVINISEPWGDILAKECEKILKDAYAVINQEVKQEKVEKVEIPVAIEVTEVAQERQEQAVA